MTRTPEVSEIAEILDGLRSRLNAFGSDIALYSDTAIRATAEELRNRLDAHRTEGCELAGIAHPVAEQLLIHIELGELDEAKRMLNMLEEGYRMAAAS